MSAIEGETVMRSRASCSTHPPQCQGHRRYWRRRAGAAALAVAATGAVGLVVAPAAVADFDGNLTDAVAQARAASCVALVADPTATQTAAFAAKSTEAYLNHEARVVPISDPMPVLKDRGSTARKAKLLSGAGQTEADAIKSVLVSGYNVIPDCSYTQFGVSTLPNTNLGGYFLASVVLAGPG
jgi:hypothetical protein